MKKNELIIPLVFITIFCVLSYYFIGWTDGNLEYAVSYFKGREVSIPFWISAVVSIIGSALVFAFNIVCEITKL
jgi:hypothetical protein